MNTGHVQYDQDSEPSKLVKRDMSELSTIVETLYEPTREQQEFYRCWAHTGHVRYQYRTCQTSKTQVSSFISQTLKTHMGWLEHL